MRAEHHPVWEWKRILLTPNRNWNVVTMKNKRREKSGKCRIPVLSVDTSAKLTLEAHRLHWSDTCREARPPLLMIWIKAQDYTAETPTWDPEFQSWKLVFQSLLNVTTSPSVWSARGRSMRRWQWASSLCPQACTPLSRCAHNPWNSCFVGIMKFFGPWF